MARRRKPTTKEKTIHQRTGIPTTERLYMVRRTFPGVSYGEIKLERGRLVRLRGFANDQKMLRLGYIEELLHPEELTISECGGCGAEFTGMVERDAHFQREHKDILRRREQTVNDLTEKQRQELLKKTGTYGPSDVGFAAGATPQEIETDRLIAREDEINPLHLDNTKANRT